MKAMIFAAGLGTRLKPLTNTIPKALVKVKNTTLLEICIQNLISFGFDEIVINVHHFADQIIEFLDRKNNFNITINISDETDLLLDTGGGILRAKDYFINEKAFLIHNVDIISNINLVDLFNYHTKNDSLATLAVSKRETSRYLHFNQENTLVGWENTKTKETIISREVSNYKKMAFSGIHILSPEIFNHFKSDGKFSIIPEYLEISEKHKISCYEHDPKNWIDVGKPESLGNANKLLKELN